MSLLLLYIQHGHAHLIKARKKSLPHRVSKQFQSSKVVVFESGKASKLSKTRSGLAQHSGRSTHGLRLRSAPHDLNCTFHVGARQTRTSAKWLNCLFRTTHARTQREASEGTMEQEKEHWHQIYKPSLKISAKKNLQKTRSGMAQIQSLSLLWEFRQMIHQMSAKCAANRPRSAPPSWSFRKPNCAARLAPRSMRQTPKFLPLLLEAHEPRLWCWDS